VTVRPESVGIGAAVLAVLCCAGLPLIAGVLGGVALATLLGVAGAILAVVLIGTAVVLGVRRHREASASRARRGVDRR
jgi:hypothetical protein